MLNDPKTLIINSVIYFIIPSPVFGASELSFGDAATNLVDTSPSLYTNVTVCSPSGKDFKYSAFNVTIVLPGSAV